MADHTFLEFFAAAAAVVGALIGLLFVAISVSQDRLAARDGAQAHRIRASGALTVFTNSLTISLFALIPGVDLGWPVIITAVAGEFFVGASVLTLWRLRHRQPTAVRESAFLIGLAVIFAFQIIAGVALTSDPASVGRTRAVAIIVVVCCLAGISRAWELIGGPEFRIGREVMTTVREHSGPGEAPAGGSGGASEGEGNRDAPR